MPPTVALPSGSGDPAPSVVEPAVVEVLGADLRSAQPDDSAPTRSRFARVVTSPPEVAALRTLFALGRDGALAVPAEVQWPTPSAPVDAPLMVIVPSVTVEPVNLAFLEGVVE